MALGTNHPWPLMLYILFVYIYIYKHYHAQLHPSAHTGKYLNLWMRSYSYLVCFYKSWKSPNRKHNLKTTVEYGSICTSVFEDSFHSDNNLFQSFIHPFTKIYCYNDLLVYHLFIMLYIHAVCVHSCVHRYMEA